MGGHCLVPVEGDGERLGEQTGFSLWSLELTVGDVFHLSPTEDMAFWPAGCPGQLLGRAVWRTH